MKICSINNHTNFPETQLIYFFSFTCRSEVHFEPERVIVSHGAICPQPPTTGKNSYLFEEETKAMMGTVQL